MRRVFFSLERAERASKAAHDANIVIRGAYILLYVHVINQHTYVLVHKLLLCAVVRLLYARL